MPGKYTKMEMIAEEVFRRKEAGETNRQVGESYGLTKYQIKQLVTRQNLKKRAIERCPVPDALMTTLRWKIYSARSSASV